MKLGVIGLGKLGLPLVCVLADSGCDVVGIDTDAARVETLRLGISPIQEPDVDRLLALHHPAMTFSTDYAALAGCEMVFIVVPTPSQPDGAFSLDHVKAAIEAALPHIDSDVPFVIRSTLMPGHTRELAMTTVHPVVYNPEFVALGTVVRDLRQPDLVVIGTDYAPNADRLIAFYRERRHIDTPLRVMDSISAEIAKLALNCYVTMKISYANSLGELCDAVGADVLKVVDAIGRDRRIGRAYLSPGAAFGGCCFPRDSAALLSIAEDYSVLLPLAQATQEVNDWQTQRIVQACIGFDSHRIAILGLAYKPGTSVTEESAGWRLMLELQGEGFDVRAHDPLARPYVVIYSLAELLSWADTVAVMLPCEEYKHLDLSGKKVIDPWRLYEHV